MVFMIKIQINLIDAKMFKSLKYMQVFEKELEIMDSTAISLCKDNKIPICVFNLFQKNNIKKIVMGKKGWNYCKLRIYYGYNY